MCIVSGQSVYFSFYNRGKKIICPDRCKVEGKAVFFDQLTVRRPEGIPCRFAKTGGGNLL